MQYLKTYHDDEVIGYHETVMFTKSAKIDTHEYQ